MSTTQNNDNIETIMNHIRKEFLQHLAEKHSIIGEFLENGELKLDKYCGFEERRVASIAWGAWIAATELSLGR